MVAAVEDGSGLVPHEILLSRLGGPWQQEGFRLALRLLRLALLARLARLPLQVQVYGLARRLRLHGRSVRGGFAAIQPLHQAMLQVRRQVVFTRGLLAGLDEFFERWAEPACSRCCRRTVSPACRPGSQARESPFSRSAEGR